MVNGLIASKANPSAIHQRVGLRTIRVLELFAGVGGFRVGLERANSDLRKRGAGSRFEVVWSNQWEPGERAQHASRIYKRRFKTGLHSNEDIASIDTSSIPEAELLVGGFPCQDYSVARTLNQATGIVGKKGVLWWEIHRIVQARRPQALLLENVDRLIGSPANQRGRDFAIILATLNSLGYVVEWRVINAADYGFPQRRRRTFIVAYGPCTGASRRIRENDPWSWVLEDGVIARAFPSSASAVHLPSIPSFPILLDPVDLTNTFNTERKASPFANAGLAVDGTVYTTRVQPTFSGRQKTLADVLVDDDQVPDEYRIPRSEVRVWTFLKGAKSLKRKKRNGVTYTYDEGPIPFPDPKDKPSRTIVTGEGGRSPSRFKHVVETAKGRYRRLTPVELEKLNGFPRNHTRLTGISDARRAFFMGNALVTGIVRGLAKALVTTGAIGEIDEPLGNNVQDSWEGQSVDGAANDIAVQRAPHRRLA